MYHRLDCETTGTSEERTMYNATLRFLCFISALPMDALDPIARIDLQQPILIEESIPWCQMWLGLLWCHPLLMCTLCQGRMAALKCLHRTFDALDQHSAGADLLQAPMLFDRSRKASCATRRVLILSRCLQQCNQANYIVLMTRKMRN